MPISSSIRKQLRLNLSSIPCKFSTLSAHRHFSALSISSTKSSEHENENEDEIEEPPISEEIFKSAPKLGSYRLGDSTFYSLIENYANSGDLRSLEKVLDRMKRERRVFLEKNFIIMFRAFGKAHLPEKAVDLFNRMVDEFHCRQTVRSFNFVLNVIILQGLYDRALEFYSYVVSTKNILPNVLTFNLIIKAMCKLGLIDRAIESFREMPLRKCTPDVFTYCTLMDGLCKENRINVLINGLCKEGELARAAKLVDNMFLKGCVLNEVTYNTLIHGLCLKGKMDKAVSLLDRMVLNKCVPNDVTYGTIVNGLVKLGSTVDGARLLISMEERWHSANEYVFDTCQWVVQGEKIRRGNGTVEGNVREGMQTQHCCF